MVAPSAHPHHPVQGAALGMQPAPSPILRTKHHSLHHAPFPAPCISASRTWWTYTSKGELELVEASEASTEPVDSCRRLQIEMNILQFYRVVFLTGPP